VRRWVGVGPAAAAAAPAGAPADYNALQVWAGECPAPLPSALSARRDDEARRSWAIENINLGADHSELHPNQAMRCWNAARRVLGELELAERRERERARAGARKGKGKAAAADDGPSLAELLDVVDGNMKATAQGKMFPYSMGESAVMSMRALNLGVGEVDLRGRGDGSWLPVGVAERAKKKAKRRD